MQYYLLTYFEFAIGNWVLNKGVFVLRISECLQSSFAEVRSRLVTLSLVHQGNSIVGITRKIAFRLVFH